MKTVNLIIKLLTAVVMCCGATACGSDEPELPDGPDVPAPTPSPEPEPEPEYTARDKATVDYFKASLQNTTMPTLTEAWPLSLTDCETAEAEVWKLWVDANNAAEQYKLPAPVNLEATYSLGVPTGTWPVNGGQLSFMYGYKGNQPESGWPLYLSLHGSGADAGQEWMGTQAWCVYYRDSPSLYFIPRSPAGGEGCRWFQPSRQNSWMRLLRLAYISGKINPDQVYFMGISEGGYGSQRLASFFADYLAGAGPIAGGEPQYNAPAENTANLFFCQRTGQLDTMFGRSRIVEKAQTTWRKLAAAHPGYYKHMIDLEQGKGHGCTYDGITAELRKHTRNPWPHYFYWENFAMGNAGGEGLGSRKGFHNIQVLEAQNGATDGTPRDAYEMEITGNNINLKIYSVTVIPSDLVTENGWSIKTGVEKSKVEATKGKVRIYLNDKLVDLGKPITVTLNGRRVFEGTVACDRRNMVESLALYCDPRRVFPAAIDVGVE